MPGRHHAAQLLVLLGLLGLRGPALAQGERRVDLEISAGYVPGVPLLLRVEVHEADGGYARQLWDAEAVLTADRPEVTLAPSRVVLRNGMGSALVAISDPAGGAEVVVTAAVGSLVSSRRIRSLAGEPRQNVSGTLAGSLVRWSGVVQVTGTVTVPAGTRLEILPGTMVLVNGVASGSGGPGITVRGALDSQGTPEEPVTITAANPALAWGMIHHDNAAPSLYVHTAISRAGRSPGEGHTNTGPAVRPRNSRIVFRDCTIGYTAGKSMHGSGDLELRDCLLVRSVMGPELSSAAVLAVDSWFMEMYGTDDNDGIYLHGQGPGQEIALLGCVFASGDDDGIDTLGSEVTIEDCIVRDFSGTVDADAKGISVFGGEVDLRRCLIIGNHVGISAKDQTEVTVRMERSTVVAGKVGIQSEKKDSSMENTRARWFVHSSIIQAPQAVRSDYPQFPDDLRVDYSAVGQAWTGTGNITSDPLFLDAPRKDFHLQAESPCIDAGDPAAVPDPDGSRADMGVFPRSGPAPPRFSRGRVNGDASIDVADAVLILFHLFRGREIPCRDAADLDDGGSVALGDAVHLLGYLFLGGPAPAAPWGACGPDPGDDDSLECAAPVCP